MLWGMIAIVMPSPGFHLLPKVPRRVTALCLLGGRPGTLVRAIAFGYLLTVASCQASWRLRNIYANACCSRLYSCLFSACGMAVWSSANRPKRPDGTKWDTMGRESKISAKLGKIQIGRNLNLGQNGNKWDWGGKFPPHFPTVTPHSPPQICLSWTASPG